VTGKDVKSQKINTLLSLQHDIDVYLEPKSKDPAKNKAKAFRSKGFKRATDAGDLQDYRWVLSMKDDVQKMPVEIITRDGGASPFKPRLFFNNGTFYTYQKDDKDLSLESLETGKNTFLGRTAIVIGADIICLPQDDYKVILRDASQAQELPWKEYTRYEIKVDNACTVPNNESDRSDFTLYSKVLTGKNFDLRQVIDNMGNPQGSRTVFGKDRLTVDSTPQACQGIRT